MACHAARRLNEMNHNLGHILAIELLISTQGVEFRAPQKTSQRLQRVMQRIRASVEPLQNDRYLADDIAIHHQPLDCGDIIGKHRLPGAITYYSRLKPLLRKPKNEALCTLRLCGNKHPI